METKAKEKSFVSYPMGVAAEWTRKFTNATTLTGANATIWVRFQNPSVVHPLHTPWPCPFSLGLEHEPFQNYDYLYVSNCTKEPVAVALPGVYKFEFQITAMAAEPMQIDLARSLQVSVGGAIVGPPTLSGIKVLTESSEYPSQIWLTGETAAPE